VGEDVPDAEGVLPQDVRVNPQRHGWIVVAEPHSHDMYRDPGQQQRGGVQVVGSSPSERPARSAPLYPLGTGHRPPGVAARWLRQPRPCTHSFGFGAARKTVVPVAEVVHRTFPG
jgi:hypothetical protein